MAPLEVPITTGLFALGGVIVGSLLSTVTQIYLDRKREQRTAARAKQLIAGELLHAQMVLQSVSVGKYWPSFVEDADTFLPTSAWHEHRASLAGRIDEVLWYELVAAYAKLELDRTAFVLANRLSNPETPLSETHVAGFKQVADSLDDLFNKLRI